MKRLLRNFIIIFICNLGAIILASMDIIPYNWKLQVMFLGGIISGAAIAAFDEQKLNNQIDILKQIRKSINEDD